MPDLAALTRDAQLVPAAIAAAAAGGDDLVAALGASDDEALRAALIIAIGIRGDAAATPALLAAADDDGLAARAAGWALGRCGDESTLVTAATDSGLDLREQAYRALAGFAARDAASPQLAEAMRARIDAELERAAKGLTSLAEHATRVLAVMGADGTEAAIQRVVESDPLADRFELDRQRKQVASEGRDQDTIKELGDWTLLFEDTLVTEDDDAGPAPAAGDALVGSPSADPAPAPAPPITPPAEQAPPSVGAATPGDGEAVTDGDEGGDEVEGEPVDWEAFAASPECQGLDENLRPLATQLGPMLEQLVGQVAQLPLVALTGQELAGLLIQVLPQAAPPQVVNAALSPQGLNAFQALARFLVRTGAAIHGEDLVEGVRLVRETMREQIRSSGMLGGPDYSDPEAEAPAES